MCLLVIKISNYYYLTTCIWLPEYLDNYVLLYVSAAEHICLQLILVRANLVSYVGHCYDPQVSARFLCFYQKLFVSSYFTFWTRLNTATTWAYLLLATIELRRVETDFNGNSLEGCSSRMSSFLIDEGATWVLRYRGRWICKILWVRNKFFEQATGFSLSNFFWISLPRDYVKKMQVRETYW